VPAHLVTQALLTEIGQPLLATTLIPSDAEEPLNDAQEIAEIYAKQLDVILDAGSCSLEPTTVVNLTHEPPLILRQGKGDVEALGLSPI
jgi:tRNA A37 threonylcarbamoyladenosine synthetase subunit TsaC/SUA5/YrdC